ncbi:MAG: MFS transporter, partial [Deltaproteobacteria bacterium]
MTSKNHPSQLEPVPHRWLITFTVMMATIMAAIDVSIVNVALPYMRGNLGASVEEITWVATGYLLSNVIVMPIIAMLTARFGRRHFYLFSILLFTGTSMLCGVAWSLSSLVTFRTLQGIGGGAIIPISQAIL